MISCKGKSVQELNGLLAARLESLRAFRFGMAGSKVKNVREGRALRRDIARILTELRRVRDIGAARNT